VELNSHPIKTKCCGCDNLTTVTGEKISALDLTLVELIDSDYKKDVKSVFSREDLAYQEARRNRKIKRLDFEIR
jgi:hypothetical protein